MSTDNEEIVRQLRMLVEERSAQPISEPLPALGELIRNYTPAFLLLVALIGFYFTTQGEIKALRAAMDERKEESRKNHSTFTRNNNYTVRRLDRVERELKLPELSNPAE